MANENENNDNARKFKCNFNYTFATKHSFKILMLSLLVLSLSSPPAFTLHLKKVPTGSPLHVFFFFLQLLLVFLFPQLLFDCEHTHTRM